MNNSLHAADVAVLLLFSVVNTQDAGSFAAEAADGKPNTLWTITDDQRADSLACYNRATNSYNISNFAGGADDKKLNLPPELIPGT